MVVNAVGSLGCKYAEFSAICQKPGVFKIRHPRLPLTLWLLFATFEPMSGLYFRANRIALLLMAGFYVALSAIAQNATTIVRLGIDKGLSNNSVRSIFQDSQGFVWIGTYDGLNRYDGYEFKTYRNRPNDTFSLPHNYIFSISEDRENNLWVATGQGVSRLDRTLSRFSALYCNRGGNGQPQKMLASTNYLGNDHLGNLIIGTNGWGLLVKKAGDPLARQVYCKIGGTTTDWYGVPGAVVAAGKTWVFVQDLGLCLFDPLSGNLNPIDTALKTATCLAADGLGNVWVGTETGLSCYSIANGAYTAHYSQSGGTIPFDVISSLYYRDNGELWIGTEGRGLAVLNTQNGRFRYISPGKGPGNLSSEAVYSIAGDREGRVWLGTHKGGCNIIDGSPGRFTTISNDPFNPRSLVSNFVYSFIENPANGHIYIGTDGGGLSIWDREANTFINYTHQPGNSGSLSHNSITSICIDHAGNTWISTLGGGINRFNKATGSFNHFKLINNATGAENKMVLGVFEDKGHKLWATTFGKLYGLNPATNKFEVFSQDINDPLSIYEDGSGQLWVGRASQLVKVDPSNQHHNYYEIGKPVRAILETSKNQFWIGTEGGGLILFDKKNGKIAKRFTDANGLCNNSVLNIVEDGKGNLWMSTFNGISRFDPTQNKFMNFFQSDGLQSNQFSYRAACKLKSGEILFGGIKGFNIFNPDSIASRKYMPPLYITDVQINNHGLAETGMGYVAARLGDSLLELRVPYNEAILSFRFNALEYSSPEKIRYAYFLEGWDRNWTYPGNTRAINYNNLREGSYTLHLRCTNAAGEWNPKEANLKIVVLPPWYRSWWAYTLYLLLAGFIVYLIYNYRIQQEKLRYKVRLTQLNAENEKALNEKRQSFFTNIAHEFRTPLTLIINPIKDFLQKEEDEGEKEGLNYAYRNARRLLGLVDQLLLFRKTETETGQMQVTRLNLYELAHDTYLYFVQQARAKKIEYLFECENTGLEVYGDRQKLEIVFFNLLSNAFKFTPEAGRIALSITEGDKKIEVRVADSGQGIPTHIGNSIFESFYQVKAQGAAVKPGFGIGLYLVKQFVGQHHGKISYTSSLGAGTTFLVTLLAGNAHFATSEVFDTEAPHNLSLDVMGAALEPVMPQPAQKLTDGLESLVSEKPAILITDDNAQLRGYLAQVFQQDFTVLLASNGEEALKLAKANLPEIIISDVMMDGMSGIEFCKMVKEAPTLGHIPFILITGSSSPESRLQGIESGADDYLTKPFEKDMLVARVKNLLKKHQSLQKFFYNEITHQENRLNITGEYKEFLEACILAVEKHLDKDDFNIHMLAKEMGMSHSSLYKKIKTISGQSANAFIRFIRLRKAAELFINTDFNVNQTAFYVGIKDIKYFREQFMATFGMKPSEYIEKYRKTLGKSYKLSKKVVKNTENGNKA